MSLIAKITIQPYRNIEIHLTHMLLFLDQTQINWLAFKSIFQLYISENGLP